MATSNLTLDQFKTQGLPEGAVALNSPDQISQYNIQGQVGTTGQTGSFLYGTPKAPAGDTTVPPTFDATKVTGGSTFNTSGTTQPPNPDPFVASINGAIANYNTATAAADKITQPAKDAVATSQNDLTTAINGLPSEVDAYNAKANELGIPGLTKQVQEMNLQIAQKTGQFNQAITGVEGQGRGLVASDVTGQQGAIRRQQAAEIGALTSVQQALQGNLSLAQQTATQAVNMQFADAQHKIDNLKTLLQMNQDNLTTAEKKRSEQLSFVLQQYQNTIDQQKADRTQVLSLAHDAAKNGADNATLTAMAQAKTPEEAMQLAGKFLKDPMLDLNIQEKQAQIKEANANAAKTWASIGTDNLNAAASWVANIRSGVAKLSDVPANLKNAVASGLATSGSSTSDILSTTQQSLKELQDMVDQNKGFSGAVGFKGLLGSFTGPIAGSDTANFAAKAAQVVNDIVLPNLNLLHGLGRVTDREFQALSSAVQGLGINLNHSSRFYGTSNLSESQFKTELKTITDRINAKATAGGTTSGITVTDPAGGTHSFPDQASADAFKKAANIK